MQPDHDRLPTLSLLLVLTAITSIHVPKSLGQDQQYVACGVGFQCGGFSFTYPFWGGDRPSSCGYPGFQVTCQGNTPRITVSPVVYRVLALPDATAHTLTVARDDLYTDNCPRFLYNTTLNLDIFSYSNNIEYLTLFYGCIAFPPFTTLPPNLFLCTVNTTTPTTSFFAFSSVGFNLPSTCNGNITVPVRAAAQNLLTVGDLRAALIAGFPLQYAANNTNCNKCVQSGGRCGYDTASNLFTCYCVDRPYENVCNGTISQSGNGGRGGLSTPASVGLAIGGAVIAGVGFGWLIFWYRQKRKRLAAEASQKLPTQSKDISNTPPDPSEATTTDSKALLSEPSIAFTRSIPSYPSSKSEFGNKTTSSFGVQVFSYNELEEATDNFAHSRELGEGGFGTVYYGVLPDGRKVAVKRLFENNFKRMEQFINEVEILTRLRHPNLVALFGCTSKRSRELILVYEYIPNGTVADHIHGKSSKSGFLSWPVRLTIAIETADALAYLHESDIIHRDVKTNNILLDNDFHVKVADFGLSRLFPTDVTHVSTAPQGTPGYVDPEYYQSYQLTEKSDVYSFGVVLIELISSLQAVDTTRHRHDINLANMAVNKIQNHSLLELVDPRLEVGTGGLVRRMATLVAELAFRCLQQERDMRPSMKEVVDALRAIQNGLNARKVEVVDILVDEPKDKKISSPPSPDSVDPDSTWFSGSTQPSSG